MVIVDRRPLPARVLDILDSTGSGGLVFPLGLLAGAYAAGAALRQRFRAARPLPELPPSIGVGNLRVGGTGKTPVVASLAATLRARGLHVGVVTRGYRAAGGGDEPGWLGQQTQGPVVRDADRWRGFQSATLQGAQVVLLDDALQCGVVPTALLAIALDRDRVRPPRPLPVGPAREGLGALRRADALLVRVEEDPWPVTPAQRWEYDAWAARACGGRCFPFRLMPADLIDPDGAPVALSRARGLGRVVLVSGLARPVSFERDAQRAGLDVVGSLRLADHARPGPREFQTANRLVADLSAAAIVCPEKTHARLASVALAAPLWRLRSVVVWAGADPASVLADSWRA